jgi:hypothetical protein
MVLEGRGSRPGGGSFSRDVLRVVSMVSQRYGYGVTECEGYGVKGVVGRASEESRPGMVTLIVRYGVDK